MKKILLEAPILTQSGYGEHSKLVFRSIIEDENVDLYINPLNWGQTSWTSNYLSKERKLIDECIKKYHFYLEACKQSGEYHD